jgi:hypothetical protein
MVRPTFSKAGIYDLTIEVASPQARDLIRVPNLQVYATAAEAPRESGAEPAGIPFLKEQQWKTAGFQTAFATRGEVAESFQATGEIIPAGGRHALVAAPISGLVAASGVAASPAPGQRVARGAVLAVLTPSLVKRWQRVRCGAARCARRRVSTTVRNGSSPRRRFRQRRIRSGDSADAAREALAGLAAAERCLRWHHLCRAH